MKKLITYTLVGLFCLSATTGFAQTKKESPQEKIIRLEAEVQILKQQVKTLQAQLNKSTPTKTYYKTKEVQDKCEKYPLLAKFIKKQFEEAVADGHFFQVTNVDEIKYTKETSSWFDGKKLLSIQELHIRARTEDGKVSYFFNRSGVGKTPKTWNERILNKNRLLLDF